MTQNCQSNPEEKEQSWRYNPCRLQTILQSYSNQNSMVRNKDADVENGLEDTGRGKGKLG